MGRGSEIFSTPIKTPGLGRVEVTAQPIEPKQQRRRGTLVVVPGFLLQPGAHSANRLAQTFSNVFGMEGVVVQTRAEEIIPNSLHHETQVACHYLTSSKFNEPFIFIGNSQGGTKATEAANTLEGQAAGLVLLDSMGLHQLSPTELVKLFLRDAAGGASSLLRKTPHLTEHTDFKKYMRRLACDEVLGFGSELVLSGSHFLSRMRNDIAQIAGYVPDTSNITCPVIDIHGIMDRPSPPGIIFEDPQLRRGEREASMLRHFPNSNRVHSILARYAGTHAMPFERTLSAAIAAAHFLKE